MIISLEQILEDEEVKRTICLMVQAELEKVNKSLAQKVHQLELAEQENFFLKSTIIDLERAGLRKDVELRELRRELLNERARINITVNNNKTLRNDSEVHCSSELTTLTSTPPPPPVKRSLNFDNVHVSTHNPSSNLQSDISVDKEVRRRFSLVHERDMTKSPEKSVCSCGVTLKSQQNLYKHIRYYHGDKKFKCSKCPSRFALATTLRKHLKGVHNEEAVPGMRYACHVCGSFFESATALSAHRKKDHSKILKPNSAVPSHATPSQIDIFEDVKKDKEDASFDSLEVDQGQCEAEEQKEKEFQVFVTPFNEAGTNISKEYANLPNQ